MKKVFFILVFSIYSLIPLEALFCGCRPCIHRYYNPSWSNDENIYYGYIDINEYPYALPVNYCFNPRPCRYARSCNSYRFQPSCPPRRVCPCRGSR